MLDTDSNRELLSIQEDEMQLPETKKRRVAPYLTKEVEDRLMIHAKKLKRSKTSLAAILIEEAMDARELLEKGE